MKHIHLFLSFVLIFSTNLVIARGSVPTFGNTGAITICVNGTYYLNPSTTSGIFSSNDPLIATVNASGYVTGVKEGTTTVSLVATVGGGTVTATINVVAILSPSLSITDPLAQASYKFNNNPQGPIGGLNNYVGYNGYDYSSQARPTNTGFFRASNQLGDAAGCPYEYYIFRCTTCGTVPEYATRPQGTLTGNTILPGSTGQLTYTSSNSPAGGPFTIVYLPTGGSNVTVNNISSTVAFNVASGTPSNTTSYKLISVTDEITKATTDFSGTTATVNISSDYVTIGTQVWTDKNLDLTTYRNGDVIAQITNTTDWANATTGAWCYYNNDPSNEAIYGKLYNWYAVNDPRGLSPLGWHIPTDAEWTTLSTLLGGDGVAGGKMKTTGTTFWTTPNTNATNESEFKGLPGGYRSNNGTFNTVGLNGLWWSAIQYNLSDAWYRYLKYYDGSLAPFTSNKKTGFSVRLIKDNLFYDF